MIKRGALGRGCGWEGGGALPLARAAVISTRSRVQVEVRARLDRRGDEAQRGLTRKGGTDGARAPAPALVTSSTATCSRLAKGESSDHLGLGLGLG